MWRKKAESICLRSPDSANTTESGGLSPALCYNVDMNTYIATFFMHFGSIRFERLCKSKGLEARTMPVPRSLSSSCGTCVKYRAAEPLFDPAHDEMEQMVICNDDGSYTQIYKAKNL